MAKTPKTRLHRSKKHRGGNGDGTRKSARIAATPAGMKRAAEAAKKKEHEEKMRYFEEANEKMRDILERFEASLRHYE
jgi:hypothetical protein